MPSEWTTTDGALRKTPSQTRALRTLDALLEAAARILATEGEAAFTTSRIAERAGLSIGTLYQYFPSRKAVIVAMVHRQRARVMRELEEGLQRVDRGEWNPEQAIAFYLRKLIEVFGRGQKTQV